MASKENQEIMNKLCDEILTCEQLNNNKEIVLGLQQAIDDLMLYKKAFGLISQDYFNSQGGFYFKNIKTLKEKYLKEARKKLLDEIIDVKVDEKNGKIKL